jgi:hypothetical protein
VTETRSRPKLFGGGALGALSCLIAILLHTGAAAGQELESKSACLQAYESSQVLRQQGHLIKARETLGICSRQECPPLVRGDCGTWLEEVERALPSVIVQATVDGAEIADVSVSIDGAIVKTRLDGKAISADPGAHEFRFETPGFPPNSASVVVREGEHYRSLPVAFQSHKTPPLPVPITRPIPLSVWVLGAVGVAGMAGFTVFGLLGNQKKQSLQTSCAPFCAPSDVDVASHQYVTADLSLLVGAGALVIGSVLFLTRPEVPVKVGITPSPGGIELGASARF